jgi:hypothetical protein
MHRLLALMLLSACVPEAPRREFGVDVFSNDTTPAKFIVSLGGNLSLAVRSNSLYMQRDKSLVIETPASLIVHSGAGTGTITSYDSTRRIVVTPMNASPDSTDAGVVGRVIRVVRVGDEERVTLALEKP